MDRLIGFSSTSRKYSEEQFAEAIMKTREHTEAEIEKSFAALQSGLNIATPESWKKKYSLD